MTSEQRGALLAILRRSGLEQEIMDKLEAMPDDELYHYAMGSLPGLNEVQRIVGRQGEVRPDGHRSVRLCALLADCFVAAHLIEVWPRCI
jgi:hypothetical protein